MQTMGQRISRRQLRESTSIDVDVEGTLGEATEVKRTYGLTPSTLKPLGLKALDFGGTFSEKDVTGSS